MKIFSYLISVTILTCFIGCGHQPVEINGRKIDIDTISFFRARGYEQDVPRMYSLLDLDSLERSNEAIEIRLTRYYSDNKPVYVLVARMKANSWTGFGAVIKMEVDRSRDSMRYVPIQILSERPKHGWDSLGKRLIELGVLQIGKEIPFGNYPSSTDGDAVKCEYRYEGAVRRYYVSELDSPMGPDKLAMTQIAELIEEELGFKNFASMGL